MRKTVYVKYSNERDDRFKIKTVIEQDENGTRYVRKYALTEAAKAHIADIEQSKKKLTQCAAGTKLVFNHCTLGDGYIDCEYVKGEPLSAILNRKIAQKDEAGALELIREYRDLLYQMATEPFVITDKFEQIFGNVEFSRNQKSCKVTDIDLIFSNILIDGDTWNVIDLEWTFDFPVPVNFLLYRAILWCGSRIREFAKSSSILEMIGVDRNEQTQFLKMEQHFQNWVKGSELSLAEMDSLQKKTSITAMYAEIEALKCQANNLTAEIEAMKCQANNLTSELNHSRIELANILQSTSWKLTKPLRLLRDQICSENKVTERGV